MLGHVEGDTDDPDDLAPRVPQRLEAHPVVSSVPIELVFLRLTSQRSAMEPDRKGVGVVGSEVLEQRLPHYLPRLQAELLEPASFAGGEDEVTIDRPDDGRELTEHGL
ncbi:hypothetical protein HRbin27_01370 [bacterium HR27]|nr:hypothetical protein HRbin27_01370 [bacterium HR27]